MEISQEGLAVLLLVSVAAGYLFGLTYDLFSFVFKIFGSKKVAVFIYDFLFCSVAGVFLCLLIYRFNDGKFRVAVPIGVILGIIAYKFTARKFILKISNAVAHLILKVICVIMKPIRELTEHLAEKRKKRQLKKAEKEKNDVKKENRNTDICVSHGSCGRCIGGKLNAVQQTEKGHRKLSKKALRT